MSEENKKNMSDENKNSRKFLNIFIIIFLVGLIVVLSLYGGDFKDRIFGLYSDGGKKTAFLSILGYLAVFVGTVLEGETTLFVSCLLCLKGYLVLPGVILAATLGGSLGDNIYFYLVKDSSEKIVAKSSRLQRLYPKVKSMVEHYGIWAVIASRFLLGLRSAIALVCSSGKMPPLKFTLLNLLSAFIWSTFYCCAIYYGGQTFERYFEVFKKCWFIVMPLLILAGIIVFYVRKKKSNNVAVNGQII